MKHFLYSLASLLLVHSSPLATAQPVEAPEPLVPGISIMAVTTVGEGAIRLAREPLTNDLYVLKMDGSILRLIKPYNQSSPLPFYTAADHGLAAPRGMAFGSDGTLYLVGNRAEGDNNVAIIRKGRVQTPGAPRIWSTVAQTAPYPLSNRNVDHLYSAIAVSPDGRHLFINAGSRTDHGEVQSNDGKFPGVREVPLTSAIIRVPADTHDLVLPNDEAALKSGGYLYADGTRNTFDLAFSPDGELFGTENSGDRDDNEELNWIREGHHYGFPWRMGTNNTPQQYPGYDPAQDTLVNKSSYGYTNGFFHDDPAYPAPPSGITFTDPLLNTGPDAKTYRDSASGTVRRSTMLATFTPHRSPLGLIFDHEDRAPRHLRGDAYMLSWTEGTPEANDLLTSLSDPGQDMLQLRMEMIGGEYRITSWRIARGFSQPIDAEMGEDGIYVLEFGGEHMLWKLFFGYIDGVPQETRAEASLSKPYPNPASGISQLTLSLPRTQRVRADVRDMLGRSVATLHDGIVQAGEPLRLTFDGSALPNGMYLIAVRGEGVHLSEPVSVVR